LDAEPSLRAAAEAAAHDVAAFIERGTPAFLRTNLALFAAGFATFALLYCVQPLLPEFSAEFGVSAAASSLTLSLTTGAMAFCLLVASAVSDAWGRKQLMTASLLASAVLTVAASAAPRWGELLALRALTGVAISGLPAVAMAYVSEEMHPKSIGLAMGLYIGGSGLGGMSGRLIVGVVTDVAGWRTAMLAIGLLGLACGLMFWRSLPPSRHFRRQRASAGRLARAFSTHLGDAALPWLFACGFALMGGFVTAYNYIGYRLLAPPFELSQTEVGLLFTVYLVGVATSALVGDLAGRLGRRRVFWAAFVVMLAGTAMTLSSSLWLIVPGVAVLTAGFFAGHSIASAWVGARARQSKAQAAALYLFFYYLGSSVAGSAGGVFWAARGWDGVAGFTGALLLAGLAMAARLSRVMPLPQ
jgi:YNFM family putative membrane transporter